MNNTPKPPKGYEVAPPEHVMRRDIDIAPWPGEHGASINSDGDFAPKGFQWIYDSSGKKAAIVAKHYGGAYRPVVVPLPVSSITLKRGRCGCWPYLAGSKSDGFKFCCEHHDGSKVDPRKTVPLAAEAWNKERGVR